MSAPILPLITKVCRRCGDPKPLTDFAIRKHKTRNGTASWCNSCQAAYHKGWKKSRKRGFTLLTPPTAEPHTHP